MSYSLRTPKLWQETIEDLSETFAKWGTRDWGTTPQRIDGRKGFWTIAERAVTVFWTDKRSGQLHQFSMDKQERPQDNLRALYLSIEAIRMNEARGIGDIVREMYMALPAPERKRDPWEVLGVRPDSPMEVVEAAYRALAKTAHPDTGGSNARMKELNEALHRIKSEKAVTA